MAKRKVKKEQPRYRVQKQYEGEFKRQYYSMLTNMSKTVLAVTTKFVEHDIKFGTNTGTL